MSQPFDINQFPDLPPEVVKAFEAQGAALESSRFEASVERAARLHEQAAVVELTELVEKLQGQIAQYKRAKFGPKSEKLDPAQLQLALEDLETAMAETEERIATVEDRIDAQGDPEKKAPRKPRKSRALPESLPRVERVIEPDSIACPCGCGNMVRIGEDRSERIDLVPAQYRVMARHGFPVDRSVLADWMGRVGAHVAPIVDRMAVLLKSGTSRLYVDETTAPVLDPGRGKTKTGYLWAVLRDDRGWGGPLPPGVVFHYRPGRSGEHAEDILSGFEGTIQVDAYGGYHRLSKPDRTGGKPLTLAFCWSHGRRKLIEAKPKAGSPIVDEALVRIAALYRIEGEIRGQDPDVRTKVRQECARPLVDAFFKWLEAQAGRVSRKSELGKAMAYMLKRQHGFRLFLDDGHVDMDSNLVENAIRSPAMNRRNALFAGHDEGGRNWARFASMIGTCKMNSVEPYAYLLDLFTKLANGHLSKDIDALMPWVYAQANPPSL